MVFQANGDYLSIDLRTLKTDTIVNYDLYLYHATSDKYVLFSTQNTQFSDFNRRQLLKNNVQSLYISILDYQKHLLYVEKHIYHVLHNSQLNFNTRTRCMFECAENIAHATIKDPYDIENVTRSKRFVKHLVSFMLQKKPRLAYYHSLLKNNYSLSAHSVNVCIYAITLSRKVGMTAHEELEYITIGSLLHDIGMAFVPDDIILKAEALSDSEFETVKTHPQLAIQLLTGTDVLKKEVSEIILHHHERLDGSGYPQGLSEVEIPRHVRIVSIADAFDAINSSRPHRPGLSTRETFQTMISSMENQFDTDLLKEFIVTFKK